MKNFLLLVFFLSFIFCDSKITKCGLFSEYQNRDWDDWRPVLSDSILSSDDYFMIHFDRIGIDAVSETDSDGDGTPDYVEAVEEAAMHSKDLLLAMGYLPAIEDNNDIYDIYILEMQSGYYGVNVPDLIVNNASFVVIDNEYEPSDFGPTTELDAMRVTTAHEFFHAVQRSYIDNQLPGYQYDHDRYFMELSSTWFEDVAYSEINDYVNWADFYLANPEQEISDYIPNTPGTDPGYALALFGHYLTKVYDDENIMKRVWIKISNDPIPNHQGYVRDVIDEVLNDHSSDFSDAWADFNARNLYNGEFENEYNLIYYFEDQKYFDPIDTQLISSDDDVNISNISDEGVRIKSIDIDDTSIFDIDYVGAGYDPADYSIWFAIESTENCNHRKFHINNPPPFDIILDENDKLHMLYTLIEGDPSDLINVPTEYTLDFGFSPGDANLNDLVAVDDAVILISVILESMKLSIYQSELIDLNNNNTLNVVDVVELVNIIFGN